MQKRRGDGEEMLHYLHDTPPALDGESVGVFWGVATMVW